MDNITGYVLKDNILEEIVNKNGSKSLLTIKREMLFNHNSPIPKVFNTLIKKENTFLAIDEHGTVRGIVTIEDIIETILGLEIMDETDVDKDLQVLAKKKERLNSFYEQILLLTFLITL